MGGVKLAEIPKITNLENNKCKTNNINVNIEIKDWEFIEPENINQMIKTGGLVTGMAGTGKSTILNGFKDELIEKKNEIVRLLYSTCSPTHKASKIINGKTIHKLFGIDPIEYTYDYKTVKALRDNGITHILVDEVSMISSRMWCVLLHIQTQYGFRFIGFGDFKQLKPPEEEHVEFESLRMLKSYLTTKDAI